MLSRVLDINAQLRRDTEVLRESATQRPRTYLQ
jgi:hypothetical protein